MSGSVHGTSAHGPKQGPERAIDTHDTRSKNSAHGSFLAAKRCPRGGAGRQTLAHDDVRLRYLRGGRGGGVRGGGATSSTWHDEAADRPLSNLSSISRSSVVSCLVGHVTIVAMEARSTRGCPLSCAGLRCERIAKVRGVQISVCAQPWLLDLGQGRYQACKERMTTVLYRSGMLTVHLGGTSFPSSGTWFVEDVPLALAPDSRPVIGRSACGRYQRSSADLPRQTWQRS